MIEDEDQLIWYVAYGSNLLRDRFLSYLTGGAGPGRSGAHDGARDTTPPRADRTLTIGRQLIFTGKSIRWNGGGVCAVVPTGSTDGAARCLGRGWLITAGQLADVWRQENGGRDPGTISWGELPERGRIDLDDGRYRRLDWLGFIDGVPSVTITCTEEMLVETNPPNADYVAMMMQGLRESWGLDSAQAVDYLVATGSVSAEIGAELLASITLGET